MAEPLSEEFGARIWSMSECSQAFRLLQSVTTEVVVTTVGAIIQIHNLYHNLIMT